MSREGGLRRSAAMLALAGGVEFGLQLALPIILVRYLDETAFGEYRMLWLLANTVMAIAPAFMPQSLFYFLPRGAPHDRGMLIGNVLLYMGAAACVTAIVTSGANPWLHEAVRIVFIHTHGMSAVFLALWVLASTLDVLPTAEGRMAWQARAMIGMALARTALLALAALATANIVWVGVAMVCVATIKVGLLIFYVFPLMRAGQIGWDRARLKQQFVYAIPFALGNAFFQLRGQADQWVVITMLSPAMYATFSIASVVQPVAALIRQPVSNAMMSRLNAARTRGDHAEIQSLILKSNGATALLLVPIIGGLLVAAPEIVNIIYTNRYQQTAAIMQVYLVGMLTNIYAVGHVLTALDKGTFAAVNSACSLLLSIVFSIIGIHYFGLSGAAIGGVLSLALGELWALRVVSTALAAPMRHLVPWAAMFPAAIASCAAIIGVVMLQARLPGHGIVLFLTKGSIYLAFFAPCFVLFGGLEQMRTLFGWPRARNCADALAKTPTKTLAKTATRTYPKIPGNRATDVRDSVQITIRAKIPAKWQAAAVSGETRK